MVSLTITTSGLADGTQIDAADVLTPVNELKVHIENLLNGVQSFDQQKFTAASELTVASGAVTITQSYHRIDTESDDATDDLDTISGGSEGDILYIRAEDSSRSVVIRHIGGGSGNIRTWTGASITLDESYKMVMLIFDGTNWLAFQVVLSIAGLTEKTTPVAADLLLIEDSAASNQQKKIQIGNLPGTSRAILRDERSTGTNGGGSTASTWNARTLQTEVSDPDGIVSIAANEFIPIAGDYDIDITSVIGAGSAFSHRVRLFNVTAAVSVEEGVSLQGGASDRTIATLKTKFTANGTDAYRIDHYTSVTQATSGLGLAVGDGSNEVYLEIILDKKVA